MAWQKKHTYKHLPRGFTLTELMIVVILVGIIAVFAIPGYQKMILRGRERSAILGLTALHGANDIYFAKHSEYLPGASLSLAAINTGLNVVLKPNDLVYSYTRLAADQYSATAQWAGAGSFTARVDEIEIDLDGGNPCCSAGACPTLPNC